MKFSFVVTGCNQKDSICDTIDSILSQSYEDFEVIYVDDASTDGSVEMVEQTYCSEERVRIVRHTENKSVHVARLAGMTVSTGDWILFADGDDKYRYDTCTVLAQTICEHPNVNMIGFGVELVYVGNTDHIDKNQLAAKFCEPHLGYLPGNKILDIIYLKQEKTWNVWNRCYSAGLAKYMLENAVRDYLAAAEDFYLTFIACSAVNGYLGIPDRLYYYMIGSGISTAKRLSVDAYLRHLTSAKSLQFTEDYAQKINSHARYQRIFKEHTRNSIYASYEKIKFLRQDEKLIAAKGLFDGFGVRNVISHLAYDFRNECTEIGNHLDISQLFHYSRKPIKTVAMLYHKMYDGGLERVMSLQIGRAHV